MGWVNRDHGLLVGRQHAVRAVASTIAILGTDRAWLFGPHGKTHRGIDRGFSSAVLLNPSSAAAHGNLGHGLAFAGATARR